MTEARAHQGGRRFWIGAFLALVPSIFFVFYANSQWEDWYITLKHSENLAEGYGLVYKPGQILHGFTSPLGTLVPAVLHLVLGKLGESAVLQAYRVVSLGLLLLTFYGLQRYLAEEGVPRWGVLGLLWLAAFECKTVAFSLNGMESAFLVFFALLALYWTPKVGHWGWTGLAWGGLMWSRPDACIAVAGLSLGTLLVASSEARKQTFLHLLKAAGVCTLVYLPWFAGAWLYYGSPVPNTVVAKAGYPENGVSLFRLPLEVFWEAGRTFLPYYFAGSGWSPVVGVVASVLFLPLALFFVARKTPRSARVASFAFFLYLCYYAKLATVFPWYYPVAGLLGLMALGLLLPALPPKAGKSALLLLAVLFTLNFALDTEKLRIRQVYLEDGLRKKIGLWLKENGKPEQTVFLECLGYIGYYSEMNMRDYPGLVSPAVVEAVQKIGRGRNYGSIIEEVEPDWLVLRPPELLFALRQYPEMRDKYRVVKYFNRYPDLVPFLQKYPGTGFLAVDSMFFVLRKSELGKPAGGKWFELDQESLQMVQMAPRYKGF